MFRMLKCGNFNLQAKPDVVFSDEAGIDADGLTRELCKEVCPRGRGLYRSSPS